MLPLMIDLGPLWLTLKLAILTTVILFIISIPIAHWLAYTKFRIKILIEAIIGMPIVLPPSVLGFYLLVAFSPANGLGKFLQEYFNLQLVFSFPGLVIGSLIYSLPFMIYPIQSGFAALPSSLREASFVLGKNKSRTLVNVLLPNIKSSLLTGIVLTFAHTVGEFGVVLMIGGNIPGQTKVASIAIYDQVELLNYHDANMYALILFVFAFLILLSLFFINNRFAKSKWQ
jgi:molybdate transport system permease protein